MVCWKWLVGWLVVWFCGWFLVVSGCFSFLFLFSFFVLCSFSARCFFSLFFHLSSFLSLFTLSFHSLLSAGPLTAASLSSVLVERFRSTLAMKLGVDPQVLQISKPDAVASGSNKVVVNIQVSNLKCTDDGNSKSAKVVQSLKGAWVVVLGGWWLGVVVGCGCGLWL